MRGQNRFPLIGHKLRNVRTFHPSLHLAGISRPVRADAAGHELAAALQHRPDAGAIPLPMMQSLWSPAYSPSISTATEPTMTTRHGACSCGQLHLAIEGEPSRIAMCHCLACQRRTGAVISNQARFPREQVTIAGSATTWVRTAESGNAMTFHFCPICGSTVYWENNGFPGTVRVAIGNLADPSFPAPTIAVWEESRHPWVSLPPETPSKRAAKQG